MEQPINQFSLDEGDVIFIKANSEYDATSESLIQYAQRVQDSFPDKEVKVIIVPEGIEVEVAKNNKSDDDDKEILLENTMEDDK